MLLSFSSYLVLSTHSYTYDIAILHTLSSSPEYDTMTMTTRDHDDSRAFIRASFLFTYLSLLKQLTKSETWVFRHLLSLSLPFPVWFPTKTIFFVSCSTCSISYLFLHVPVKGTMVVVCIMMMMMTTTVWNLFSLSYSFSLVLFFTWRDGWMDDETVF